MVASLVARAEKLLQAGCNRLMPSLRQAGAAESFGSTSGAGGDPLGSPVVRGDTGIYWVPEA